MSNPSPTYPAGTGEALVWIAYRGDALLDEIKIIASDSNGRPVANVSQPVQLEWVAGLRSGQQGADWARRLSDVQQGHDCQALRALLVARAQIVSQITTIC